MRPENVTVPDAAAFIGVPEAVAMSNPVCEETLILLDAANLDVIVPDTGLIKLMPISAFFEEILVEVFTVPVVFLATLTIFTGSTYNLEIASCDVTKSLTSVSYFSTIVILDIFVLFF